MPLRILLIAMVVILGGCAAYSDISQERFDALPQKYSQFDLKIAWDTKVADTGTVIDGVLRNARYFEMVGVEVWVTVLDNTGKALGRSASFIIPRSLREGETAPFRLSVPVRAVPGTKLQFTYRYRENEGNDEGNFWMQSFEVAAPGAK